MFQLSKIATPRLLVAVLVVVLVGTVLILRIAGRGLIGTAITSFKTPAPARDVAAASAYAYVITEDHKLWVVDVSTPTAPAGVGFYSDPK